MLIDEMRKTIEAVTQSDLGPNLTTKREFLAQIELVVPWAALVGLVTAYATDGTSCNCCTADIQVDEADDSNGGA